MIFTDFNNLKTELLSLKKTVASYENRTIRDEELLNRFINLSRTWNSSVKSGIEKYLRGTREFNKLGAELEAMAKLASKYKSVYEYRTRLSRSINLAKQITANLPLEDRQSEIQAKDQLFIQSIPDLPISLVPNALIGWKSQMEQFTRDHPFDRSVFIMIRYRPINNELISELKALLSGQGLEGIVASDHKITDDMYNPVACLLCCSKAITVFDAGEIGQIFNPNVAYELGMFHLLGREIVILKHSSMRTLNTDILMKLYSEYDNETSAVALEAVS